ncbi:hypothetical protein FA15DRAFT_709712 [Coprinopsis marcescibilis]|uniref:Uncharacterized protein n=1 Tax=Coprinopsis marcescibilis TaxID=230819 RepID=A0A5C3KEZ4_COPMA|nr:hypothetical protein FA15DRAFT_709712 [Coprinopsis marcescibilis]
MILSTYLAGPASPWTFGVVGLLATAAGAQIITEYDDSDPSIVYSSLAGWFRGEEVNPMHFRGFNQVTTEVNATATLRFTGRRVEYHAALWADRITTQITLDTGTPEVVSLQDPDAEAFLDGPSTQVSALRWSAEGLDPDTVHILVIGVPPNGGFGIVDLLMYAKPLLVYSPFKLLVMLRLFVESDEPAASSLSSAFTVPPVRPTGTPSRSSEIIGPSSGVDGSESPHKMNEKTIGIAVGCTVGVVIALSIAAWMFWRQRKRKGQLTEENLTVTPFEIIDPQDSNQGGKGGISETFLRNQLSAASTNAAAQQSHPAQVNAVTSTKEREETRLVDKTHTPRTDGRQVQSPVTDSVPTPPTQTAVEVSIVQMRHLDSGLRLDADRLQQRTIVEELPPEYTET